MREISETSMYSQAVQKHEKEDMIREWKLDFIVALTLMDPVRRFQLAAAPVPRKREYITLFSKSGSPLYFLSGFAFVRALS